MHVLPRGGNLRNSLLPTLFPLLPVRLKYQSVVSQECGSRLGEQLSSPRGGSCRAPGPCGKLQQPVCRSRSRMQTPLHSRRRPAAPPSLTKVRTCPPGPLFCQGAPVWMAKRWKYCQTTLKPPSSSPPPPQSGPRFSGPSSDLRDYSTVQQLGRRALHSGVPRTHTC